MKWVIEEKEGGFNIDKVETGDRIFVDGTDMQSEALAQRVCDLLNQSE